MNASRPSEYPRVRGKMSDYYLMIELCRCWRHPRANVVHKGHCCACLVGSAICVHRLCCLDVYCAHTESAHLLADIKIRLKPQYEAVSSPSVLSSVARLRAGVDSTFRFAENGRVRRCSRRWGKGVGVVEVGWVRRLATG